MRNIKISPLISLLIPAIFILLFIFCSGNHKPKIISSNRHHSNHTSNQFISTNDSINLLLNDRLNYLIKAQKLYDIVKIEDDRIEIFNPQNTDIPEITVFFNEINFLSKKFDTLSNKQLVEYYKTKGNSQIQTNFAEYIVKSNIQLKGELQKPLIGVKIAIDAGHIAGSYQEAQMEWRALTFANNIKIYEAELAFFTALFLQDTLQKLGAEVVLTRQEHGSTAFNKTYSEWLQQDFKSSVEQDFKTHKIDSVMHNFLLNEADSSEIFHAYFKRKDIRKRAEIINTFKPNLAIVIHYNIYQWTHKVAIWQPVRQNFTMSFVPGAYLATEMDSLESRAFFLRQLISDNHESSVELSNFVHKYFKQNLNINTISKKNKVGYIHQNCNLTKYGGIYARNLFLLQFIKSPVCYSEALCQDNIKEYKLLSKRDIEIQGYTTSSRLKEISSVYFDAIIEYMKN